MRGLAAFAVLCLAVSAYAQMPPTQTKKGLRPSRRRGDNPDVGMPSGKDVPDGRRFVPPVAAPAKSAPRYIAKARHVAPPARPVFPADSPTVVIAGPRPATRPVGRPVGRRNDNPDVGLPSGADVPDRSARPVAPVASPTVIKAGHRSAPRPVGRTAGRRNDNTVIKAGPRPVHRPVGRTAGRRNDNPDVGLPSGADIPDGRRNVPLSAKPFAQPARPVAPAASPTVIKAGHRSAPRPVGRTAGRRNDNTVIKAGPRPAPGPVGRTAGRRNDNPDVGLPSGADVPDDRRMNPPATRTRSGPAPPRRMRPTYNVLPTPSPEPQPVYNPWAAMFAPAPPAPVAPMPAPPMPVFTCEEQCHYGWSPVCSVYGNTYDTYCRLQCSGEPYDYDGQCQRQEPNVAPQSSPVDDPFFGFSSCNCDPNEYNPVCTEDDEQYNNKCMSDCEGKTLACSSHCPC